MNGRPSWTLLVAAVAIAILGMVLRGYQLGDQILMDDELNSVVKLAESDYAGIFGTFGVADHSIPMTLFFKWLADEGRLSEAWMLGPSLVFGCAAWFFLVARAQRAATPLAVAIYAALLAISPLIVLYTRQARPYAITLFLVPVAMWAAWQWVEHRRARHAVAYVGCAVMAAWLHIILIPVVLGVWAYFLADWALDRRGDRARLRSVLLVLAPTLGLMAVLLTTPFLNDWQTLQDKTGRELPTPGSVARTLLMMAGTTSIALGVAMGLMAALGTWRLWRTMPGPTRYVVWVLGLHAIAICVSGATWLGHPLILSRYLLVAVPFLLFAVATGFAWCVDRSLPALPSALLGVLFVAMCFASGPLPRVLGHPNAFVQHKMYFVDFVPEFNEELPYLTSGPVPAFYRELGKLPPRSKTLIEAPWRFESMFNRLALFQEIHRQRVQIGMVGKLCPPGAYLEHPLYFRNRFRHFIDLAEPAESLRRKADYVVFHRRLVMGNMTEPWQTKGGAALPPVDGCIAKYREEFGAPIFEDETITVFALHP